MSPEQVCSAVLIIRGQVWQTGGSQVWHRRPKSSVPSKKIKYENPRKVESVQGYSFVGSIPRTRRDAKATGFAVWQAPDGREEAFGLTEWMPPVDISEDDKEYTLKAELPWMSKEDVKVTVENGVLSITGERKEEKEAKDKKYYRVERSYGSFIRSFTLPEGALADKISAEFKDGILKLHLPKDEKAKSKTVDVKIS
jgi:HSP20 family protein